MKSKVETLRIVGVSLPQAGSNIARLTVEIDAEVSGEEIDGYLQQRKLELDRQAQNIERYREDRSKA